MIDDPLNSVQFEAYCRSLFDREGESSLLRFSIGVYQINKIIAGLQLEDKLALYGDCAACAIHVTSSAIVHCRNGIIDHPSIFGHVLDWSDRTVLNSVTALTQQYVYVLKCKDATVRAARIKSDIIRDHTATLVASCLGLIESGRRRWAIESEMKHIDVREWRR